MTDNHDNLRPQFAAEDYERIAKEALRAAADLARLLANTEESLATMHTQYKDASMRAEAAESRESELREQLVTANKHIWQRGEEADNCLTQLDVRMKENAELREKVRVLREAAENHVCDYIHHMGTDGSSHGTKPCVICKALAATADEPKVKEERT